jgi:protein phosphatase
VTKTALRWGSATDRGLVRRNNQDHLLVGPTLFAVADGMGGHAAGEVASEVAIGAVERAFGGGDAPASDDLRVAVEHANQVVYQQAQHDPALRGMGTTLTVAAVVVTDGEERIAVANVGDSRAYVFAHGDLTQLTEDHSVAEELVRQGQISPDEVDTHPQRHILTRALGIFPEVEVDVWEVLPYVGDRLLLCSDGLVREIADDQIASVLRRLSDPSQAAQDLVARARAAGGSDNITVVVVDVVADGDQALVASEAVSAGRSAKGASAVAAPAAGEAVPAAGRVPAPLPFPAPGTRGVTTAGERDEPAPVVPLPPRRKRVTVRAVAFVVVLAVVLAGAAVALVSYARDPYFVTLGPPGSAPPSPLVQPSSRPLVIEKGRPGGLLWFHPTFAERTGVLSDEVLPSRLPDLQRGKTESSLSAARAYVANLVNEARQAATGGPTTTAP